jgi:CHAD domain-containing protein
LDGTCRSELEGMLASFRKERKKELKRLKGGLREIASRELRDLCRRVINSPSLFNPPPDGTDLFAPLADFAGEAFAARLAMVLDLVPKASKPAEIEAQHLLRIAVKHFRYRLEILSFLFGHRFPEIHGALKGYQEVLGKMHDLDVFAGIVREAGFPSQTETVVLGAIAVKRGKLFIDFSGMLKTTPFEKIGEQVRHIP